MARDTLTLTLSLDAFHDVAAILDKRTKKTHAKVERVTLEALMRDHTAMVNRLHAAGIQTKETTT